LLPRLGINQDCSVWISARIIYMNKKHLFIVSFFIILAISLLIFQVIPNKINAQENSNLIPNQYIVVFKDSVSNPEAVANEHAKAYGLSISYTYKNAVKGYSAIIPEARLEKLRKDFRIEFISQDRIVSISASTAGKSQKPTLTLPPAQKIPTGIRRIGVSSSNFGTGIGVAVIDTGIDLNHPDLSVIASKSCVTSSRSANDDNGHGSHVAGTIAALNNTIGVVGVAPEAKLVAVKVLDRSGSGTWSSVICGIDWVTANAINYNIKVANMSLSGGGVSDNNCGNDNSDALHRAICNSTAKSITYVVAAGNEHVDASNSVPAAYNDTVITVSALVDSDGSAGGGGSVTPYGSDDTFASFSNYGDAVDLGAPGVNIYSTWKSGGYNTISGTSMASPHVAGVAALYIKNNLNANWQQVRDALVASGEPNGSGHTDLSGLHPEPIVLTSGL